MLGPVDVDRRHVFMGASASAALLTTPDWSRAEPTPTGTPVTAKTSLTINGTRRDLYLDTRTSLLDALR